MPSFLTAALYQFVELPDCASLQAPLLAYCEQHCVKGTLLLATEGINGTIAGPEDGVRAVLDYLRADPRLQRLEHKEAWAAQLPFYRMKVRLKREIVTLGVPDLQPALRAGQYVKAQDWNQLISDPEVVLVDTRNAYEVAIGTFPLCQTSCRSLFSRRMFRRSDKHETYTAYPRIQRASVAQVARARRSYSAKYC